VKSTLIPAYYRKLVRDETVEDPLGRMVFPQNEETLEAPGEYSDPTGDALHSPLHGVVHRHPDRVLVFLTWRCVVYCRFCFRKERIGVEKDLGAEDLLAISNYIDSHPDIREIILTGGDPMAAPSLLLEQGADLARGKTLRIHTRLPVVAPEMVSQTFLDILSRHPLTNILLHINHARELSPSLQAFCKEARGHGALLGVQSTLLRDVNDSLSDLLDLYDGLRAWGIRPHHLHHLDTVPGTSHFRVPLKQGMRLFKELTEKRSPLWVPNYTLDIPGGHGKIFIHHGNVKDLGGGLFALRDSQGHWHAYNEKELWT